jgi:hypothetical protein
MDDNLIREARRIPPEYQAMPKDASVDCPLCGRTIRYDSATDMLDVEVVEDDDGKTWTVFRVRCTFCRQKVPAGGKDGSGSI